MTTYAWFVRGAEHARMCAVSMASVRKVDPHARCYVFTDERGRAWEVPAGIYQLEPAPSIMLANLEAQLVALSVCSPVEPLIFLDTDTLILQPLGQFHQGDLTVTWRDSVGLDDGGEKVEGVAGQMPYNFGVMMFAPGLGSIEAVMWMRERVRRMHSGYRNWYGNQLALTELCGQRPLVGQRIEERRIPWSLTDPGRVIRIQKLPCELYNYTPQAAGERVDCKAVLHFKGRARDLMGGYATAHGVDVGQVVAAV